MPKDYDPHTKLKIQKLNPTSIWPSVVKGKTTPIDRNIKIMNKTSVFESDFLTNDSLVPAFVFCRGSQSLTRPAISGIYDLHQTSIEIN